MIENEKLEALNELERLKADNVFSVNDVKDWIGRYTTLRRNTSLDHAGSCFIDLPCFCTTYREDNVVKQRFMDRFDGLKEVLKYHRFEECLKEELKDKTDLITWCKINEHVYDEIISDFLIKHFDYDNTGKDIHLGIYILSESNSIFVHRKDFINMIEVNDAFVKLLFKE